MLKRHQGVGVKNDLNFRVSDTVQDYGIKDIKNDRIRKSLFVQMIDSMRGCCCLGYSLS